jgi:hypothetical protein
MARPRKLNNTPEWKQFEELIAEFHRSLPGIENVRLTPNERVRGKITERLRQLDLTLRYTVAGIYPIFIAIEARDYGRVLDVHHVEAFIPKLADVGAKLGIIITSSSFSDSAVKTARHYGIELLALRNIPNFDWSEYIDSTVFRAFVTRMNLTGLQVTLIDTNDETRLRLLLKEYPLESVVIDTHDSPTKTIADIVRLVWEALPTERQLGLNQPVFQFEPPAELIVPGHDGFPIRQLVIGFDTAILVIDKRDLPLVSVQTMGPHGADKPYVIRAKTDTIRPSRDIGNAIIVTNDNLAAQPPDIQETIRGLLSGSLVAQPATPQDPSKLRIGSTLSGYLVASVPHEIITSDDSNFQLILESVSVPSAVASQPAPSKPGPRRRQKSRST